jgi:hypothetical protein
VELLKKGQEGLNIASKALQEANITLDDEKNQVRWGENKRMKAVL